ILLCQLEMFDIAKGELEYVLKLDEKNADAHYNLGVLYAVSTKDTEKALYHLEQAFQIQPEHEQAKFVYDMVTQRLEN
ncbi:MAG: hypothetical protein WAP54_08660, partial [Bacteroidales bacterium]